MSSPVPAPASAITPDPATDGKRIFKIALTGGPCGGKTTLLPQARALLQGLGCTVLTINEAVTELYGNGLHRSHRVPNRLFVYTVMHQQFFKEQLYLHAAREMAGTGPVAILCDRGLPDGRAYFEDWPQWERWAEELGCSFEQIRSSYAGAVHLVTAAQGAEEHYNLANEARFESTEQARIQDRRVFEQWQGHPRLAVIENGDDGFEGKLNRALAAVGRIAKEALA